MLINNQRFYTHAFSYNVISESTVEIEINNKSFGLKGLKIESPIVDINVNKKPVYYFAKIPYAKPPTGIRRFRYPQPLDTPPWHGIYDSTKPPNSCFQGTPYSDFDKFNSAANMWFTKSNMSEDCLYLSLWSPNIETIKLLPVMVWIYGGSYMAGSTSLEVYDGSVLASYQNVIVVTLQFRMGPFGFLYMDNTDSPGNQALMDQRMAFKWIKSHIKRFGGDPDQITLFGESSGATSISMHMLSDLSKDLFKRVILQSGTVFAPWAIESPAVSLERTKYLAKEANCSFWSYKAAVKCLQKVPAADIVNYNFKIRDQIAEKRREKLKQQNYQDSYSISAMFFDIYFRPIIDDKFISKDAIDNVEQNKAIKSKDILLGTNSNEGIFFLIYGLSNEFSILNKTRIQIPKKMNFPSVNYIDPYRVIMENILDLEYINPSIAELVMYEYDIKSSWFGDSLWNGQDLLEKLDAIAGDTLFICSSVQFADSLVKSSVNNQVYMYWFDYRSSQLPVPEWCGVMHGYEIEYVFGIPFTKQFTQLYYGFTEREKEASKIMMNIWGNFAKYGNPTKDGLKRNFYWPHYSEMSKRYVKISDKTNDFVSKGQNFKNRKCLFWTKILPRIKTELMKARNSGPRIYYPVSLLFLAICLSGIIIIIIH